VIERTKLLETEEEFEDTKGLIRRRSKSKMNIQYNTIQYNTIQYNTIQYNTMAKRKMERETMIYKTL
jgi:hypothetical protein